jgi:riboflavin synthase
MFTGLVSAVGRLARIERSAAGASLRIDTALADELAEGDSVAVDGVCLTAVAVERGSFVADAMNETLARTALGELDAGAEVNLELPLRAGDRLGGHFVQGHVDGIGRLAEVTDDGIARLIRIEAGSEVLRYVVEKGSIAVQGVSLTVAGVGSRSFTVSLIPETLERTNLGGAEPGATLNLEVDVLAKYVEKAIGSGAGRTAEVTGR